MPPPPIPCLRREDVPLAVRPKPASLLGSSRRSSRSSFPGSFAEDYEMYLRGKTLIQDNSGPKYKQTSKAIAGEAFINNSSASMRSFANPSNLISRMKENEISLMFEDVYYKNSGAAFIDRSILEKNNRAIMKNFKDRTWFLTKLVVSNDENMSALFDNMGKAPELDRKTPSLGEDNNNVR